tara:strand:+ start:517 stop:1122 length:606 start_codon:yes stop_codon:yes gene_type:complete
MSDFSNTPMIELAAIVAEHLDSQGIKVVLVGGLAVEVYTENLYLTQDIDMVNTNHQPISHLNQAMSELGFTKQGRVYVNPTTPVVVEFPTAPLSVGDELIQTTTCTRIGHRDLPILMVDDVIKDRLAAFIHWKDNASLVQAMAILLKHQLLPERFRGFCLHEGSEKHYELLSEFHTCASNEELSTMDKLETMLTQILVARL